MTQMQPQTGAADSAAANPPIERLLRRSMLMLMRATATVQDRLDFAELAEAVDAPVIAAVARETAMLRQGFAPAQSRGPRDAIARAIAELKDLMSREARDAPAQRTDALDPAAACAALSRLLSASLDRAAEAELAGLLDAWRGLAETAPVNPGGQVDAPLADLLSAYATHELQAFLRRNHVLAFAPYGSARLLHDAARLGNGGLGPYFSGVGNIVRGSADVLGLIALAAGDQAAAMVEHWVVPLASGLPEIIAVAVADDLADLGMIGAVRGLLDAAARRSGQIGLMRHLRDAALDLGDDTLALSAQHEVLGRAPYDAIEWRRMGAMLASVDDRAGAEAALAYALKLVPGDKATIAQLDALNAGDFSAFAVKGGFATPLPRQRVRFARRAA